MVSPGFRKAKNTASFADAPQWGLYVGGIRAKEGLDAINGQCLSYIHVLATAVVALARVAFCVLVCELAALGFHHSGGGVVFAGDQLNVLFLAKVLRLNGGKQCGVGVFNQRIAVEHGSGPLLAVQKLRQVGCIN